MKVYILDSSLCNIAECCSAQLLKSLSRRLFIVGAFILFETSSLGQVNNRLIGRIYANLNELTCIKNYHGYSASVLENEDTKKMGEAFAFLQIRDTVTNTFLIIFEKILKDSITQVRPTYLILDTLTIQSNRTTDWISFCECFVDTVFRPEIIALVNAKHNPPEFKKIQNAWYADVLNGKILPLPNKRRVWCWNGDYTSCGDEDE